MSDFLYLIWSNEHKAWWRSGGFGYTSEKRAAGFFKHEEAVKAVTSGAMHGTVEMADVMVVAPAPGPACDQCGSLNAMWHYPACPMNPGVDPS